MSLQLRKHFKQEAAGYWGGDLGVRCVHDRNVSRFSGGTWSPWLRVGVGSEKACT